MYTEQDFWRDYPPNKNPFVFPWLQEKHEREIQKVQAAAREALRAKEAAEKTAQEAKMESRIETANALLAMGMDLSIISKATNLSEQQILALKAADLDANTSIEAA